MAADTYGDPNQPYSTETQPQQASQPPAQQNYRKVATAPDGVPVYQDNGGNYYTQNADQSYTQQFQGGAPSWLKPQGANGGGATPSYYNASDPIQQAVWGAFQAKGINPRDQADFQYWVDKINQSGGLANGYQNTGGSGTWADRMASANGGVGDYRTGGAPIAGGTMGGGGGLSPADQARRDAFFKQLMDRSNQSLNVDANDPSIMAQVDPFRVAQSRGMRQQLSAAAEASGPNGNIGNETRMAAEHAGEATAQFQGQLIDRERQARRQEIAQALQLYGGMLSDDQKAELQREDLALQSQLGNRNLDLGNRNADNSAAQQAWENQYKTLFG